MNFPASLSADMSLSAALQIGSKIQIPNKQTASAGNLQAKAIIVSEDLPPLTIPCQFNPSTIHISKGANWRSPGQSNSASGKGSAPKWDVPYVQFEGGEAPSMSLDLLFDTTDSDERDVRIYTEPLISLTQIHTMGLDKDSQRPRLIRFIWPTRKISFSCLIRSLFG